MNDPKPHQKNPTPTSENVNIPDHLDEFRPYLENVDIPEDQQAEFLALMWSIMVEFASLGFGADTASQAIAAQIFRTDDTGQKPERLAKILGAADESNSTQEKDIVEVEYE